MTIIQTPRLIIRAPTHDDVDAIHAAKLEVWPELQKWMSWARDSARDKVSTVDFVSAQGFNPLCGFDRDSGGFVISTGLDAGATPGEYATGYWVARTYLGRGYATESTNAVLRYAFHAAQADAVRIRYYEGNEKSASVIRKLGFEFVETLKNYHTRFSDGKILDAHEYVRRDADNLPALEVTWS